MNKLKSMMFDSRQLKLIGLAMTLIGAVGITFFSGAGQETIRLILEFISYPAIAIFAYLVVEGHQKTDNLRKYNIALLLCAIATEPFYDYACIGSWLDYGSANGQNFLFALLLCQFVILLLRTAEASENWKKLMIVSIFPAIPFWAMLSNVRFSGVAMLFTALFYLLRMKPRARNISVFAVGTVLKVTGGLGVPLVMKYSGQRGSYNKYLFYAAYPAMWMILAMIKFFL